MSFKYARHKTFSYRTTWTSQSRERIWTVCTWRTKRSKLSKATNQEASKLLNYQYYVSRQLWCLSKALFRPLEVPLWMFWCITKLQSGRRTFWTPSWLWSALHFRFPRFVLVSRMFVCDLHHASNYITANVSRSSWLQVWGYSTDVSRKELVVTLCATETVTWKWAPDVGRTT